MKRLTTLAFISTILALASCFAPDVVVGPDEPLRFDGGRKSALPVTLVLEDGLESAGWRHEFVSVPHTIELGDCLIANCEAVVGAAFADVSGPVVGAAAAQGSGRATLSARLVGIARTRPPSNLSPQRTTLRLEWRLQAADGRLIWAQTVSATGESEMSREGKAEQVRLAVEELFHRSLELMRQAPSIALASRS